MVIIDGVGAGGGGDDYDYDADDDDDDDDDDDVDDDVGADAGGGGHNGASPSTFHWTSRPLLKHAPREIARIASKRTWSKQKSTPKMADLRHDIYILHLPKIFYTHTIHVWSIDLHLP